jgi:hypothetical protein
MTNRTICASLISAALLAGHATVATAQARETFKIRLITVPIDFVQAPKVTGSGTATAVLTGTTLTVQGTFEGLQGPATIAQIRVGRAKGVRGPVVGDLTAAHAAAGEINGTVTLKPEQIDALKAGRMYVQIHSEAAPDGNLWGWLLR